ncbi:hypothetical protein ACFVYF_06400 [Streptomyces sp. NPDC058274]|uniref:hypothetical protein n=1 Tax=Streptomyces sp. NPDC058274 TaxID=3346416 RepID=UPI0036E4EAA7
MNRRPRVLATALAAGTLLTSAAACSGGGGGGGRGAGDAVASASPAARQAPSAPASASAAPAALTEAQAGAAMVTAGDLGPRWAPSEGAATWHDAVLKARADRPDCQRLLDGLYEDDLLGEPSGARVVTGFDDGESGGQLRYEVAAYGRPQLDAGITWLQTMPVKCGQFTATNAKGTRWAVQVVDSSLPELGDARQGLRMMMTGDLEGAPATLTLDIASVRVGDSALTLTDGGLEGADDESTRLASQLGTQRLKDVAAGKTPAAASPAAQEG